MRIRVVQPVSIACRIGLLSLIAISLACATAGVGGGDRAIPAGAAHAAPPAATTPVEAASAGGMFAASGVFRVVCTSGHSFGTGFLHRSGRVITAAHVVTHCATADLEIVGTDQRSQVGHVELDRRIDVALLTPTHKLQGVPLRISRRTEFPVGLQVTTWGFPEGYRGMRPLLSVGYFSGAEVERTAFGRVQRWVVNAAFNSGNSGGPLVDLQDHTVMGVVCSKLAPIPPQIESALEALKRQRQGVVYPARRPDGTIVNVSEGEVVAEVLTYLRRQTQLVLGYAATSADLRQFLHANGVEP